MHCTSICYDIRVARRTCIDRSNRNKSKTEMNKKKKKQQKKEEQARLKHLCTMRTKRQYLFLCIDNGLRWTALTSFLHVTCTRYTVSGQRDNSTLDESVNKWPIRPPPETSHVTIQLLCKLCGSHAKCVDTRNSCSIIDAIRTIHEYSDGV